MPNENPASDSPETTEGGDADGARSVSDSIKVGMINELVPGTLTLHFPRRDVDIPMMGADAVRILTAHRRGRLDGLTDDIDPDSALMLNGWLTIKLDKALVVSWTPGPDAAKAVADRLVSRGTATAEE